MLLVLLGCRVGYAVGLGRLLQHLLQLLNLITLRQDLLVQNLVDLCQALDAVFVPGIGRVKQFDLAVQRSERGIDLGDPLFILGLAVQFDFCANGGVSHLKSPRYKIIVQR